MLAKIERNLETCIQEVEYMNICFYQQKNNEGYQALNRVLENVLSVIEELNYLSKEAIIEIDVNQINKILETALYALEEKDYILFADIMQFELVSNLKEVSLLLKKKNRVLQNRMQ
ncbi:hypothetical protein [Anaerosporobacter faecicola]|uniref:hypothetical protein n=1 Tax=Anaerosporobacter faecicola TaxID=2718714 RepID=UPI00143C0465|nr:hypothetical protein [Anaerosporobacter faecicola]